MACLAVGTISYILTLITKEYSWVDRIWSVLPILFQGHILYHQHRCSHQNPSLRQFLMFGLTIAWGARLTYNFFRKGGYAKGGEDYRWKYIRERYNRILVELLNLVFTAYYQIILIFWFSSPIVNCQGQNFNAIDIALIVIWFVLFFGEVIADEQQWVFQT